MTLIQKNSLIILFFLHCFDAALGQASIFSIRQNGILAKSGIDCGMVNTSTIINGDVGQGNGVAVDIEAGKVYYAAGNENTIKKANFDGSGEETVVGDAGEPFGIHLDFKNNRLYWIARNPREVRYIDLANPATINTLAPINGGFPITVLVDTTNNKVYWNHRGNGSGTVESGGQIICQDLGDNSRDTILRGLRFPSGMVIFENKLYWNDFGNGNINRANLDGSDIVSIEAGYNNPIGLDIDPTNRKAYVLEQGGNQDIYCTDIDDLTDETESAIVNGSGAGEHIALLLETPEIAISGNNNSIISSKDVDPSTTNATDFGNVVTSGATQTNTFTIANSGNFTLNLTNTSNLVTIGGTHAADFTVMSQPSSSIATSGNTTFSIKFDPSANGLREATVTIISNDCDEATFCFKIQGTGVDCPDGLFSVTPAQAVITNSTCTKFGGTPDNGKIEAPTTTNCPTGTTLQYSKDNSTFSSTTPAYNQTTSETIYTKCVCNSNNGSTSMTTSVETSPGTCPNCPDLSAVTPANVVISESICNGTVLTDGAINTPSVTNCPNGSTLHYSTNNSTFSTSIPAYDKTTSQTIYTKCICDHTATNRSPSNQISTNPPTCASELKADDLSVTDPCDCANPKNIILADGRYLFQDILKVTTTTGLTVTLSATDNNLLDASGSAIPINTTLSEVSAGNYELEFFTLPSIPASVTVSNGASTENFTTDSCVVCPEFRIPTFNQWTFLIYSLLVLNLGLMGLKLRISI